MFINQLKLGLMGIAAGVLLAHTAHAVNPASTEHRVGQAYQGGKIFYVDATGQHGFIAAEADEADSKS